MLAALMQLAQQREMIDNCETKIHSATYNFYCK